MLAIQALLTVVALMGDVPSANDAPKGSPGIASTFAGQHLLLSDGQTSLGGAQFVMEMESTYNFLHLTGHSGSGNFGPAAFIELQSSRGTRLAPTPTLAGDYFLDLVMYGRDNDPTFPQFAQAGGILWTAEEDFLVGHHASRLEIGASDLILETDLGNIALLRVHNDGVGLPFVFTCTGSQDSLSVQLCADSNSHTLKMAYQQGAYSQVLRAVDTFTSGAGGAAPASGGGTANFLRADATWAPPSGTFVAFTTKTSGTTITLTSTTHSAYVVACGAGGGGGGTTTAAASAAVGGGGAAGACVGKRYTSLTPSAVETIAIGAAGTAGSSSGGDGGLGGDSTFSDGTTVITGKGGNGGKGETAGSAVGGVDGGAGVIGTLGDWNGAGAPGTPSMRLSGLFAVAGTGGSCAYGGGGIGSGATGTGATALGRCSGGGGGNVENNSTAVAGGAGTGGVVLVWEYQ